MEPQNKLVDVLFPNPTTTRGQPGYIQATPNHLLYFNGSTVVVRSINDSSSFFISHIGKVSAAKFSNNYRFIVSIDEKGTLLLNELAKNKIVEVKKIEGFYMGAKRIDWTSDDQRVCVVGSGKSKYGKVVSAKTWSDIGDIKGVNADLTAVSFRPQRPFRLCLAGNQHTMKFYDGPPYKFAGSKKSHTNFINELKYNENGSLVVSVSSDRKIVLYEGKTGQIIKQLQKAHQGGIMGVSWLSNDSFVTVGSDKYLRFWNTNLQSLNAIPVTDSEDQMKLLDVFIVGVSYCKQTDRIYCLTLSGEIKQFDGTGKFLRSFEGWRHQPLQIISPQTQSNSYYILDNGGKIIEIDQNGKVIRRQKLLQSSTINYSYGSANSNNLFLLDLSSNVSIINLKNDSMQNIKVQNSSYVLPLDDSSDNFILIQKNGIKIYQKKQGKYESNSVLNLKWQPTAVFKNHDKILLGSMRGHVIICLINQNKVQIVEEFQNTQNRITYLTISQNLLFIGQSTGAIKVYDEKQKNKYTKITDSMGSHTATITSILFYDDLIYTFSMDNSVSIWDRSNLMRKSTISNIHRLGILSAIKLNNNKFVTSGGDYLVKVHNV